MLPYNKIILYTGFSIDHLSTSCVSSTILMLVVDHHAGTFTVVADLYAGIYICLDCHVSILVHTMCRDIDIY